MPLLVLFATIAAAWPGASPLLDVGGPDGFGYVFETTQDHGDTISFAWLDPSGHAVLVDWHPNGDDGWTAVGLPFRFPFYGDTLDSIIVCSNGFLQYPTNSTSRANQPLPVPALRHLIALFWDDLNPGQSGSVRKHDDPEAGLSVITWLDVVRHNTDETLSAQVVLYAEGRIRLNFLRVPGCATSSTVGIQGHAGDHGQFLQYVSDGVPARHVPVDLTSVVFYVRHLDHDVGVVRSDSPEPWVPTGAQCPVNALVRNYGSSVESFPVSARLLRAQYPFDTVFSSSVTVSGLGPRDSVHCYFGDWLVPQTPDSWQVVFASGLECDSFRRNDTCRGLTSSVPPRLGTILCSRDFPDLGDGLNLTGVTYCPDSDRFYLNAIDPNRVFSLSAGSLENGLRLETFELQSFFGDDLLWGTAWDRLSHSFWLGHVPNSGPGCILARYAADGSFAGDTWNLAAVEPGIWFAGIDIGPQGRCHAVAVGGENRIYELDLGRRQVVAYLPGALASYRACSFVGDEACFIISGGWNQNALLRLSRTGSVLESSQLVGLADFALFRHDDMPAESLVWGIATTSSEMNTVHFVSLGRVWANVGMGERAEPASGSTGLMVLRPNPARRVVSVTLGRPVEPGVRLDVCDLSGRVVRSEPVAGRTRLKLQLQDQSGSDLAPGVYIIACRDRAGSLRQKFVVSGW